MGVDPRTQVDFLGFDYRGHDPAFDAPPGAGEFHNPILAGSWPDPSLCRAGDDFYLVNSTFAWFPGLQILHSRDLVHWRPIGWAIDRPSQLDYRGQGVSRGLFAPAISHHGGTFFITCTLIDRGGNFVVTAADPAGPWSDPQWLDFDGIDPSLFFDDDGRAWMLNNGPPPGPPQYSGHRAIWQQQFDVASRQLVGPRRVLIDGGIDIRQQPVWIEGPHLFKRGGWYYLSAAEGGTSVNHSQVILRSRSVTGPFEPWALNPILTQRELDGGAPGAVTCTGHADFVIGPDAQWWAVFLGCRPLPGRPEWLTGRETFLLPVRWTDDGWPQILPPGERVPLHLAAPGDASVTASMPTGGNFHPHDRFEASTLSPDWFALRAPQPPCWSLSGGRLTLSALEAPLTSPDDVALLARRVQHARFEVTTRLQVPRAVGITAGLTLFQSAAQHDLIAVRRSGEGLEVFVERVHQTQPQCITRRALPAIDTLTLRIRADEHAVHYSYALDGGDWQTLTASLPIDTLTVQSAGGGMHFTGAVIGLHARAG